MPRVSARSRSLMKGTSPVPSVVDVSLDSSSSFGSPPISNNKIKTPLSALYDNTPSHNASIRNSKDLQRLGITKAGYEEKENQHDDHGVSLNQASSDDDDSSRIGISPGKYETPKVPTPPPDLFFQKKLRDFQRESRMLGYDTTASPHHVYWGEDDASSVSSMSTAVRSVASNASMGSSSRAPPAPPQALHDGIKRLLHPQTAQGQFLVNNIPTLLPEEGLRYNLAKRKTERRASSTSDGGSVVSSTSTLSISVASSSVQSCATPYKIFCLLLQPARKIFELIHLLYNPHVTTVGDLIQMIPENATEPALGLQKYVGFVRPKEKKRGAELLSTTTQMASPGRYESNQASAGIMCGEILVGLPEGYTCHEMRAMARIILKNPQIVSLLLRKNPLAPETRSNSSCSSSNQSKSSISTTRMSSIVEEHPDYFGLSEGEEDLCALSDDDEFETRQKMDRKMDRSKGKEENASDDETSEASTTEESSVQDSSVLEPTLEDDMVTAAPDVEEEEEEEPPYFESRTSSTVQKDLPESSTRTLGSKKDVPESSTRTLAMKKSTPPVKHKSPPASKKDGPESTRASPGSNRKSAPPDKKEAKKKKKKKNPFQSLLDLLCWSNKSTETL